MKCVSTWHSQLTLHTSINSSHLFILKRRPLKKKDLPHFASYSFSKGMPMSAIVNKLFKFTSVRVKRVIVC